MSTFLGCIRSEVPIYLRVTIGDPTRHAPPFHEAKYHPGQFLQNISRGSQTWFQDVLLSCTEAHVLWLKGFTCLLRFHALGGHPCQRVVKETYCGWTKSISHLRNPKTRRLPCKYQPTMASYGFKVTGFRPSTVRSARLPVGQRGGSTQSSSGCISLGLQSQNSYFYLLKNVADFPLLVLGANRFCYWTYLLHFFPASVC